ncbi:hypothetical protein WA026_020668 [Henosepilachna vigintioctopunctata]|uniref:Uncharacterized protein n=1 Tax=Henosepilachna vigintioctopunctata TaxID=420089 RepID=A0AAW1UAV1_9CUCU
MPTTRKVQSPIDSLKEKAFSPKGEIEIGASLGRSELITEYKVNTTLECFEDKPMFQKENSSFAQSTMKSVTSLTIEEQLYTDSNEKLMHLKDDILPVESKNASELSVNYTTNVATESPPKESITQREQCAFEPAMSDTPMTTKVQSTSDKGKEKSFTSIEDVVIQQSLSRSTLPTQSPDGKLMLQNERCPLSELSLESVTPLTSEKLSITDSKEKLSPLECEDISPVKPQQKSESRKNYDTNVPKDSSQEELTTRTDVLEPAKADNLIITKLQSPIDSVEEETSPSKGEFVIGQSLGTPELTTEYNTNTSKSFEEQNMREKEKNPLEQTVLYTTKLSKESPQKETITQLEKYVFEPAMLDTPMISEVQSLIDSSKENLDYPEKKVVIDPPMSAAELKTEYKMNLTSESFEQKPMRQHKRRSFEQSPSESVLSLIIETKTFVDSNQKNRSSASDNILPVKAENESEVSMNYTEKESTEFPQMEPITQTELVFGPAISDTLMTTNVQPSIDSVKEKSSPSREDFLTEQSMSTPDLKTEFHENVTSESFREKQASPNERIFFEALTSTTSSTEKEQSPTELNGKDTSFCNKAIATTKPDLPPNSNENERAEYFDKKLLTPSKDLSELMIESIQSPASPNQQNVLKNEELEILETEHESEVPIDYNVILLSRESLDKESFPETKHYVYKPITTDTTITIEMKSSIDSKEDKSSFHAGEKDIVLPLSESESTTKCDINVAAETTEKKPFTQSNHVLESVKSYSPRTIENKSPIDSLDENASIERDDEFVHLLSESELIAKTILSRDDSSSLKESPMKSDISSTMKMQSLADSSGENMRYENDDKSFVRPHLGLEPLFYQSVNVLTENVIFEEKPDTPIRQPDLEPTMSVTQNVRDMVSPIGSLEKKSCFQKDDMIEQPLKTPESITEYDTNSSKESLEKKSFSKDENNYLEKLPLLTDTLLGEGMQSVSHGSEENTTFQNENTVVDESTENVTFRKDHVVEKKHNDSQNWIVRENQQLTKSPEKTGITKMDLKTDISKDHLSTNQESNALFSEASEFSTIENKQSKIHLSEFEQLPQEKKLESLDKSMSSETQLLLDLMKEKPLHEKIQLLHPSTGKSELSTTSELATTPEIHSSGVESSEHKKVVVTTGSAEKLGLHNIDSIKPAKFDSQKTSIYP